MNLFEVCNKAGECYFSTDDIELARDVMRGAKGRYIKYTELAINTINARDGLHEDYDKPVAVFNTKLFDNHVLEGEAYLHDMVEYDGEFATYDVIFEEDYIKLEWPSDENLPLYSRLIYWPEPNVAVTVITDELIARELAELEEEENRLAIQLLENHIYHGLALV